MASIHSQNPVPIRVPCWVRKEIVYPALGICPRTLDEWMARRHIPYRKFPGENGLVRFPAGWLLERTGPIRIEAVITQNGDETVEQRWLTAEVEIEGMVGVTTLAKIHDVCANTIRYWARNKWIPEQRLPSGHGRFNARFVEYALMQFDRSVFVPGELTSLEEMGL